MDKNGQNKNCNKIEYCLGSGLKLLSAPRAIALWRDETSDKKHEEIRRLSSSLIEKNPKVFEPLFFARNSVEEHVKNSKITGTWHKRHFLSWDFICSITLLSLS